MAKKKRCDWTRIYIGGIRDGKVDARVDEPVGGGIVIPVMTSRGCDQYCYLWGRIERDRKTVYCVPERNKHQSRIEKLVAAYRAKHPALEETP